MTDLPRLYDDLASWFHLLTRPEDYSEEAEFATKILIEAATPRPRTLLELGSGGGNNAFHLKLHFQMTLTDLSGAMLEASRRINPECRHVQGDMRVLRLDGDFDAVFIHDAIGYMRSEDDLGAALQTARLHCRRGGVVLIMPDYVRETFRSGVGHGGHDGAGRGLRYFEWTFDPDPTDTTYTVDFVYLLREGNEPVRVVHDQHVNGVFERAVWVKHLNQAGFSSPQIIQDPWGREVFLARK